MEWRQSRAPDSAARVHEHRGMQSRDTSASDTELTSTAKDRDDVEYPEFPQVPVIGPDAPQVDARPTCRLHGDRRPSPRPPVLCDRCSQSMMGYIAVLQEALDAVAEDIAEKGAGRRCLWCIKDQFHDALHSDLGHKLPPPARKAKSSAGGHQVAVCDSASQPRAEDPPPAADPLHPQIAPPSRDELRQLPPSVNHYDGPASVNDCAVAPPVVNGAPLELSEAGDDRTQTDNAAVAEGEGRRPRDEEDGVQEDVPVGKVDAENVARDTQEEPVALEQTSVGDSCTAARGEHYDAPVSPDTALSASWLESPPPPVRNDPLPFPAVDRGSAPEEPLARAASWDRLHGLIQPWITEPVDPETENEAYVTMATDNVQALGCMVLGNSLRLSATNRTLVVLVTDAVNSALRHLLGSVFHLVQPVRALDPQGTTKLALLEQPELGISFWKLHAWRLTSFSKCVFLDADTLVVQNCDELFGRSELSAVPDIGWPDYFNSGVFVYSPSLKTFLDLIEFADSRGFSDGGEQGLLNLYFRSWVTDVSKRLPFIYNLMANVSYTYTPAFRKFGRDVKIAHFFGSYKPWHVLFHYATGQMSPSANVHPTYAQFVHFWMDIFQKRVLPLFTEDIHRYCRKNSYISAQELMNFFPAPPTSDGMESLPTPPSFRVHLPSVRDPLQDSEDRPVPRKDETESESDFEDGPQTPGGETEATEAEAALLEDGEKSSVDDVIPEIVDREEVPMDPATENYHKMMAWEQGRMDYLGRDSSDNIIKRLQTLIKGSQKTA